jgi:hypothetical protein
MRCATLMANTLAAMLLALAGLASDVTVSSPGGSFQAALTSSPRWSTLEGRFLLSSLRGGTGASGSSPGTRDATGNAGTKKKVLVSMPSKKRPGKRERRKAMRSKGPPSHSKFVRLDSRALPHSGPQSGPQRVPRPPHGAQSSFRRATVEPARRRVSKVDFSQIPWGGRNMKAKGRHAKEEAEERERVLVEEAGGNPFWLLFHPDVGLPSDDELREIYDRWGKVPMPPARPSPPRATPALTPAWGRGFRSHGGRRCGWTRHRT